MTEDMHCFWPGCTHEPCGTWDIPIPAEKDTAVSLPFCPYHQVIVASGKFHATLTEWYDEHLDFRFRFDLHGPFDVVELVEQVLGAKQMAEKYKAEQDKKP